MFDLIEARFAAAGQTPKGRKALREIFRATRHVVGQNGLYEASLDAIADRAGLTQAALRHYFRTRDDLLTAFFIAATEWLRSQLDELLALHQATPHEALERCVAWHLEYMESVDTAIWLESSAYWLRKTSPRRVRDDFYSWLTGQYAALIGRIRPELGSRECQRRAYSMLTLVLGAWITHGRGSATGSDSAIRSRRQLLIDAALDIALQ
jgi:AcrR family transcriptional regulator